MLRNFSYLGRSGYAVAFIVYVDVYHVAVALLHLLPLLAERHEEVFHQSPVQESAVLVDPCHTQPGKLAHGGVRMQGGGYQTLVHIEVDEDFELLSHAAALGHVAAGQQDFAVVAAVQIHPEVDFFYHLQAVVLSQCDVTHRRSGVIRKFPGICTVPAELLPACR